MSDSSQRDRLYRYTLLFGGVAALGASLGVAYAAYCHRCYRFDTPEFDVEARRVFESTIAKDKQRAARRERVVELEQLPTRPVREEDIEPLAQQWYDSYNESGKALGATKPLFASLDIARTLVTAYVRSKTGLVSVEKSSSSSGSSPAILASAFQDESDVATSGVVGCGPWTVQWKDTNKGVGRDLFEATVRQSIERGGKSLRLLQGPTNLPSYAVYVRLGFQVREPLAFFSGAIPDESIDEVLAASPSKWQLCEWSIEDVPELDRMWSEGTGFSRVKTLENIANDKKRKFKKFAVKENGKIIAWTTGFGSMGSSCAVSESAFKYLLCSASRIQTSDETTRGIGPMFHVATRLYPELVRWLLEQSGLRVERGANLMVLGLWQPIDATKFFYAPSTELN